MIEVGDRFPDFKLQDQDGNFVSLDDLKGSKTIVFFYPKDDTPGCTVESCEFRDSLPNLTGVRVIGVSADSVKSHKKFVDKFKLGFTLLADVDKELSQAVGVWGEKSFMGRKFMGIARTTFLLDETGAVVHIWRGVKPKGHAQEVRAALQ